MPAKPQTVVISKSMNISHFSLRNNYTATWVAGEEQIPGFT